MTPGKRMGAPFEPIPRVGDAVTFDPGHWNCAWAHETCPPYLLQRPQQCLRRRNRRKQRQDFLDLDAMQQA